MSENDTAMLRRQCVMSRGAYKAFGTLVFTPDQGIALCDETDHLRSRLAVNDISYWPLGSEDPPDDHECDVHGMFVGQCTSECG
jgi:hypothetical protein